MSSKKFDKKEDITTYKELYEKFPIKYQRIGDIIIINTKKELWKFDRQIGKILLKIHGVNTVCRKIGPISGKFRKPKIKIIAGSKKTETIHKENGIKYKLDVSKIMFSKGNLEERKRLISQIKEGEIIVDMFAGIGYFSLGIAKFSKPKKIFAIEINPESYQYLKENVKINKVESKVVPILGDCKSKVKTLKVMADRIIMGLLPSPKEYLPPALEIIKKGGIIHYHSAMPMNKNPKELIEEIFENCQIKLSEIELLNFKRVKSYAPKINHVVLDIRIKPNKSKSLPQKN